MIRYIGKGITDENGIAKLTEDAEGNPCEGYTGTGAGIVNIFAECRSIQSEIYSLLDAIFIDYGVTGKKNSNWTNYNDRLGVVTDETGTTLTGYESSNGYYIACGDNPFTFTDYTAEFTVVGTIHSYLRWFHQNQANTNENVFIFNNNWFGQDENTVKITVNNGVATLNVNGRQRGTTTLTVTSPYEIGFRFTSGTQQNTLTYKDFQIY